MSTITATILWADGRREERPFPRVQFFQQLHKALDWPDGADTVNLRNGYVMLVDDTALIRAERPPANDAATRLYLSVCRPGTDYTIHGNAAVVRDSDFI